MIKLLYKYTQVTNYHSTPQYFGTEIQNTTKAFNTKSRHVNRNKIKSLNNYKI